MKEMQNLYLALLSPNGGTLGQPHAEAGKAANNLDSWMTGWGRDTAHLLTCPALVYGQEINLYYIWTIIHFGVCLLKQLTDPNWYEVIPESLVNKTQ